MCGVNIGLVVCSEGRGGECVCVCVCCLPTLPVCRRSEAPSEIDALREKTSAVQGAMAQNIERLQDREARLDQVEESSREGVGQGCVHLCTMVHNDPVTMAIVC